MPSIPARAPRSTSQELCVRKVYDFINIFFFRGRGSVLYCEAVYIEGDGEHCNMGAGGN